MLKLSLWPAVKICTQSEGKFHMLLTLILDEGCEWSASRFVRFAVGKRATDTHWIRG
jgi:hypothetical protein